MALPVVAALLIAAYMAIDRWTAVPWAGPDPGDPVVYRVVDAATGRPIDGARIKLVHQGLVFDIPTARSGQIRHFGGPPIRVVGHRSAVRDTRSAELGDTSLLVTAEGYEEFSTEASSEPLLAHPAPDGRGVEYVVRLRRVAKSTR
jgi:hypothetical protein